MSDSSLHQEKPSSMFRALFRNSGMIAVFGVLFILVALLVPNFFSLVNLNGLMLSVATVGIIASTMLFCLAAGDFDLSVGSIVAAAGILAAVTINATGSVMMGIVAGIVLGGLVGIINGFVIAALGINALISTLATMQIVRGFAYIISDGKAIGIREEGFFSLGVTTILSIPAPVWIMILCFLVFGVLLNKTIFGRHTLAVGGNKEAARLAGIPVKRVKMTIFALQGVIAGFAGVILASRMTSGQPATAQGLELQVISACVLGGVSLSGGVGSMSGVIVGVLIMGTVQNAMNLLNIPPFYQYVASGAILLASVMLDRLRRRSIG
ncbi:MAG TPA: L-arabinose ABC transporter permease AraH [Bacteroidota bacterium]|jgi:L-arabinose transport system permease protein|nr:L-arabinose ABC transporter permease AraH [Bacteroidota bacterium]